MFKLGRGGGGGGRGSGKRPLPPARPATAPGGARMAPMRGRAGGPAGRGSGALAATMGKEESFSLLTKGEVDFGAIVRLTPDLVEEIRRVEAEGGVAKIKFDSNSAENVIDVGGKEFRFTWSREPGHLCDIYEEHQSGEDGDGLLVERGSAWRKMDVNRILDESAKHHVKMRSEEAERLSKSRKVHLLDHSNPSMKNQVKSMAAAGVEGSMRRTNWKQKKEPFPKKRKVEPNQGAPISGPPKSAFKLGISSNKSTKNELPVSPIQSPAEQPVSATSALPKGDTYFEETTPSLNVHKEHIVMGNHEKEMPSTGVYGPKGEVIGHKSATANQPADLQRLLINLLSQNPKGMSLKVMEKAVAQTVPNAGRKIESVIKNIATYQAPGRYLLKPGLDVESSKKGASESGSSPDSAHDHTSAFESLFGEEETIENYNQQDQLNSKVEEELEPSKRIDILQDNSDLFNNGKNVSRDSGGIASSSDSGSDSESESESSDSGSESGSQSKSRSKSRSPVGSGSASSSDSETDGSSSSKEGSDVDVDIMTSVDEKEEVEPKSETAELRLSSSLRLCRASDDDQEKIDIIGRDEEGQVTSSPIDLNAFGREDGMSNAVADAKVLHVDESVRNFEHPEKEVDLTMDFDRTDFMVTEDEMPISPDQCKQLEEHQQLHVKSLTSDRNKRVTKKSSNEKNPAQNDMSSQEQTENFHKPKLKRTSVSEYFEEKSDTAKRSKGARSAEVNVGKIKVTAASTNLDSKSPDKLKQDEYKFNNVEWDGNRKNDTHVDNLADRGRSIEYGNTQKTLRSPEFRSSSNIDVVQTGRRTSDLSGRKKTLDRITKNTEGMSAVPDITMKDKTYNNIGDENTTTREKMTLISDSCNRNSGDYGGNMKDKRPPSQIRKSDVRNSPLSSTQGVNLRRELSDLELGEFREPSTGDETGGVKRQFEGNSSFKSSENRVTAKDYSNFDNNKEKVVAHPRIDSKHSPVIQKEGVHVNQEVPYRKVPPDDLVDSGWGQPRTMPSQYQSSKMDHADTDAMDNLVKSAELVGRSDTRISQVKSLGNLSGAQKKTSGSFLPECDIKHDGQTGSKYAKESRSKKSNTLVDSTYGKLIDNDTNGGKRRESLSDGDDSFYSKYDKEEPELRGPIKDYMHYKEYVQEYNEKYKCYISLNKALENIRDNFLKVGEDIERLKGRDIEEYYKVIGHLKEMYLQHGSRNKQMKKVFITLHDELKTLKQRIQDFAEIYARG